MTITVDVPRGVYINTPDGLIGWAWPRGPVSLAVPQCPANQTGYCPACGEPTHDGCLLCDGCRSGGVA